MSFEYPAAPCGNRHLTGFMIIGMLAGIANGMAKVLLPLYAAFLHASKSQIGLVGGLQFVGLLLLSLPVGTLLARVGSRRMFRIGGIGGAIVYALLFPFASTPTQLIACVILFGIFNPMRMVTTQTEFLQLLHTVDPRRAGWNRAAHSSGMFLLGPMLGATALATLGYAGAFQVSAIALLLAVLIGDRTLAALPAHDAAAPRSLREHMRSFVDIVRRNADLRRNLAFEFFGQTAMTYFGVFAVLIAIQKLRLGTHAAAAVITIEGACFIVALLCLGFLVQRLRETSRYLLSFGLLALAQAFLMLATAYWALLAGAVLLGVGLGTLHLTTVPCFAALAQRLGRGRVGGLFTVTGPCGGIVGAIAGGVVAQSIGLAGGFALLFVLFVALFAFALLRGRYARASLSLTTHESS